MELIASTVTVQDFFTFQKNLPHSGQSSSLFYPGVHHYSIPRFQREYTWGSGRVDDLVRDISAHDKLLGMVTLNYVDSTYDIVDGQQRITSLQIILAALFNAFARPTDAEPNREQKTLLDLIFPDQHPVLINKSIGTWMKLSGNHIDLCIDSQYDVYHQKQIFTERWDQVTKMINQLGSLTDFRKKLLDCKLLVLICESLSGVYSAEQIFLDMNDKTRPLDPEDIFKGYCFNLCNARFHDELKEKWGRLKENFFQLSTWSGDNFSRFLYHYILCIADSGDFGDDLKSKSTGKHFLEDKSSDDIIEFLDQMIAYSLALCQMKDNLGRENYCFEDICPDISRFKKDTDISRWKDIVSYVMEQNNHYCKFPLMFLIYRLRKDKHLRESFTYSQFCRLLSNYLLYVVGFANRKGRKGKSDIAIDLIAAIQHGDSMSSILDLLKILRKSVISDHEIPDKFQKEHFSMLYSALDNFVQNENTLSNIYNQRTGYNEEHFILHANRRSFVVWNNDENDIHPITIYLTDLLKDLPVSRLKNCTANFMIIEKSLNENILLSYDIVTKIQAIEKYYQEKQLPLPLHISIFTQHIKDMASYQMLTSLKGTAAAPDIVEQSYTAFVREYFSDYNRQKLYERLHMYLKSV